jgi:hypothetical protein
VKKAAAGVTAWLAVVVTLTVSLLLPQSSARGSLVATGLALGDIPGHMLALYQQATAARCPGMPWSVLAAVGKVETNHARNVAVSSAGALGPMQFMPATWRAYGVDADGDGIADVMSPVDSVHGAAHYLCASGAGSPVTLRDAIWAYNHADWYVELVLEHAAGYAVLVGGVAGRGNVQSLLTNPRVVLSPRARGDLAAGLIDDRVVAVLGVLAERHTIGISVLRSGHSKYVAGTSRVSNHWCGQGADIWMIDGAPVTAANTGAHQAAVLLSLLQAPLRPSEVGTPWPALSGSGFFSDAAHRNHLHIGFGPRCADF